MANARWISLRAAVSSVFSVAACALERRHWHRALASGDLSAAISSNNKSNPSLLFAATRLPPPHPAATDTEQTKYYTRKFGKALSRVGPEINSPLRFEGWRSMLRGYKEKPGKNEGGKQLAHTTRRSPSGFGMREATAHGKPRPQNLSTGHSLRLWHGGNPL